MAESNCTQTCEVCKKPFEPKRNKDGSFKTTKYLVCSDRCLWITKDRAKGVKPQADEILLRIRASANYRKCLCCGKEYVAKLSAKQLRLPNRNELMLYCSKECKAEQAEPVFTKLHQNKCKVCGKEWLAKIASTKCSVECSMEYERRRAREKAKLLHPIKHCKCKQCGIVFVPEYGSMRRSYCSEKCAKKAQQQRKGKSKGNNAQRAKAFGVKYSYFNELRIFVRDQWRCQLCGVKTPQRLRGTHEPNAPELDHIVPLSQGGDHLPENCQCTCRKCNGSKGAKALGQMNLLGFADYSNRINRLGRGASIGVALAR